MNKTLNILLSASILLAVILANSGYYKCYSMDTVHVFENCCNEVFVKKTCCASNNSSSETEINSLCCNKINIHSLDLQNLNPAIQTYEQIPDIFLSSFYFLTASIHEINNAFENFSPPENPPALSSQNIYKLTCSYLC